MILGIGEICWSVLPLKLLLLIRLYNALPMSQFSFIVLHPFHRLSLLKLQVNGLKQCANTLAQKAQGAAGNQPKTPAYMADALNTQAIVHVLVQISRMLDNQTSGQTIQCCHYEIEFIKNAQLKAQPLKRQFNRDHDFIYDQTKCNNAYFFISQPPRCPIRQNMIGIK